MTGVILDRPKPKKGRWAGAIPMANLRLISGWPARWENTAREREEETFPCSDREAISSLSDGPHHPNRPATDRASEQ